MTAWVIQPDHFLRHLQRTYGLRRSEMRIPRRVVLSFGRRDWLALKRAIGGRTPRWHGSLAIGRAGGRPAAAMFSVIGAPATAAAIEEAVALGAREILSFGACGSLVRDLHIGSVVVPVRAYSDEGTSRHYGGGRWSRPDGRMVEAVRAACRRRGLSYREGSVWTTDAVYREGRAKALALARRGVVAVDMEASAIYAVANSLGVRAASLFVVSDELAGDSWKEGFAADTFRAGKQRTRRAILDFMAGRKG